MGVAQQEGWGRCSCRAPAGQTPEVFQTHLREKWESKL